jgi:hypothetical protein
VTSLFARKWTNSGAVGGNITPALAFDAMTGYGGRLWRTHSVNGHAGASSGLLSAFEVVVWMTDGWPLYESRLKGELHVISKPRSQSGDVNSVLRQHQVEH